ncbi:hypothetical protein, variant [Verruconis gallopava]|uniref:T6SS Phospholipase effector Tle1-like catalytic domain-containing protein n=1 Tax=Verruconis gallopava TaxID=253628 RepID=A0A0D1Z626_9PEZI|nr:hypothetical protein, variant [Verruconis gallopava]KIW08412.1 hypothetical protein, variant [Verruconis gallopava]
MVCRSPESALDLPLIGLSPGTWLNSDDGMLNGELAVPSNVTRMSRAIKSQSRDGIPQIVYYHRGVGSQGGIVDRVFMGAVGEGLGDAVREAYSFISTNYTPGDEIFLIGFSRGAFTVRAVAGMIGTVGLLTKKGLPYWPEIFKDVTHAHDKHYRPKEPNLPFPNKPRMGPAYREELWRRGMTDLDAMVKAIGVFDTVGSLGLPRIDPLVKIGLQRDQSKEMRFYDTKLGPNIENAFQALALDEKRAAFSPAVWERPPGCRTKLRQVWFPGVHSNVGGGYDDQEIADITLAWMMAQFSPFLDMYDDYIIQQWEENQAYYRERRKKPRPWSFGKIYNSSTGVYALGGSKTRTPGCYYATDPDTGQPTDRPLEDTNEYVHPSVRTRFVLRGPGEEDKGDYQPEALDDWKLVVEYPDGERGAPEIYWKARFKDRNVSTRILPECPLWRVERRLLGMDPEMEEEVMNPPPTSRRQRRSTLGPPP